MRTYSQISAKRVTYKTKSRSSSLRENVMNIKEADIRYSNSGNGKDKTKVVSEGPVKIFKKRN